MPTAKDNHNGIGGRGGPILPTRDQSAREPEGKPDRAANLPPDLRDASDGSEHILLGLIREGDNPATQVLNGLGADPDGIRQEVVRRVSARRVVAEPADRRVTSRGPKRRLVSELHGRLDSLEWRLSVLEQRVGTGPGLRDLEREIAQVRRDKESAIDVQDFEGAAVLRDRESQLLDDKAAREQEWAALPSLSEEIERLRDLLHRHGIDPQNGAA